MPDEVMKLVEELEAGLEGVTDGPWRVNHGGEFAHYCRLFDASGNEVARTQWDKGLNAHRNIAWLRICSPDNIRKLIAAIKSRPRPSEEAVEAAAFALWCHRASPKRTDNADARASWAQGKDKNWRSYFDESRVVLRAALSAIPHTGGDGWMPIETAPRDGSEFLVCLPRQGSIRLLVKWNKLFQRFQSKGDPITLFSGDIWHPVPALSGDA